MKVLRAMFFLLNPTSEHSPQGWWVCVASLLELVAGKCWACQVELHRPPGDKSCCPVVTATIRVFPEPDRLLLGLQLCRGTPSHSWGVPWLGVSCNWRGPGRVGDVVPWLGLVHFSRQGLAGDPFQLQAVRSSWEQRRRRGSCVLMAVCSQGLAAVGRAKTRLLGVLGTSVTAATHLPCPRTDLGLSFQTRHLGAPPAPQAGPPTPASCAVQPRCGRGCAGQVPCCGLEPVAPGGTDRHPVAHRLCHDAFSENMAGEAQLLERRRLYHCAAYTCAIALVRCVFTELRFYQGFLFSEKPEKVGPSRPLAVLPGSCGVGLGLLLGPTGQGGEGWGGLPELGADADGRCCSDMSTRSLCCWGIVTGLFAFTELAHF